MPKTIIESFSFPERPISPRLEFSVQTDVRTAMAKLLSGCGLYQNVSIELYQVNKDIGGVGSDGKIARELSTRPLNPVSEGSGSEKEARQFNLGKYISGSTMANVPLHRMPIPFYLPGVSVYCSLCKSIKHHESMACSTSDPLGSEFPKESENSIEQIYIMYYKCMVCNDAVNVFMVRRSNLKLQLTGRFHPSVRVVDPVIPKAYTRIVSDAISAKSEGDISAAYYHLRTFIEHYLKCELKLSVQDKITGEELCSRYNAIIDMRLRSDFPNVTSIYAALSSGMHSRECTIAEFDSLYNQIHDHLKAKALFDQYRSA